MKRKQTFAWLLALIMAMSIVPAITAYADTSADLRKKVVSMTGIMTTANTESVVTRGQFARMLVNASSYQGNVGSEQTLSLFADVSSTNEYAPYIRIAVEEGWMTGYLGGNFKPDQAVTLQDAIKGLLALLDYQNSDFGGSINSGRLATYHSLSLDDKVGKGPSDTLVRMDCINLFYNLLKTNSKSGSMYGKIFDCTLTSDGEINCLALADNSIVGPIVTSGDLESDVPFSLKNASVFVDGSLVSASDVGEGNILYYHRGTKTIWVYEGQSVDGKVEAIYYDASATMTPEYIVVNGENYYLTTTDAQFAFSVFGDMEVGDDITLVYEVVTVNGEERYQVVDYAD